LIPSDVPRVTLYVAPESFDSATAEVTGDAYRHLFRARRLAVGDSVRAVDGRGRARAGRVVAVGRSAARIELGDARPGLDPVRRLTLVVAPPRPERAAWLVEKATELGVARIAWLDCERSTRSVSPAVLARHGRIAIAALEQCGGATLPEITGPHTLDDLGEMMAPLDRLWFLDPLGSGRADLLPGACNSLGLAIGPEGGWSDGERRALAGLRGASWGLGDRVLRVETAAVVGAALVLAEPGSV
jgi:16S rRNA (uracil1498-N3)-methyltransferase